jgi:hypothetical protein
LLVVCEDIDNGMMVHKKTLTGMGKSSYLSISFRTIERNLYICKRLMRVYRFLPAVEMTSGIFYVSILAYLAFFSINARRGATSSPISMLKV